jgi:MoxR-like ATPase/Mg-chelatase subunit ChlD
MGAAPNPAVALVGRTAEADLVRAAIAASRHLLLEGPAGAGKSLLVDTICAALGRSVVTVNATTTMSAAHLLGQHDPAAVLRKGFHPADFQPGPLMVALRSGAVLYLDEANRLPPNAYDVIISAVDDGEVVVPRYGVVAASAGFLLIAASNPDDAVGTHPPPRAFLDRVVRLRLGHQDRVTELAIVDQQAPHGGDQVRGRAVAVVQASRRHPELARGSSVRGALDMVALASQLARLAGDPVDRPAEADQRLAAVLALSSKVAADGRSERTVEGIIDELWSEILITEHRARPGGGAAPWAESALSRRVDRPEAERDAAASAGDEAPPGTTPADEPGGTEPAAPTSPHPGAMPGAAGGVPAVGPADAGPGDASAPAMLVAETDEALVDFVNRRGSTEDTAELNARGPERDLATVHRIASRIVVRRLRGTRLPGAAAGRTAPMRFTFRSDDLDLDRTIAELLDKPLVQNTDIWVQERVPRRRGVVLLLDVSGSMRGDSLVDAGTAAAAAALAVHGEDELAVVAFWSRPMTILRAQQRSTPARLVEHVLSLRPHGLTDIAAGLAAGLTELGRMRSPVRLGIVLTDGVSNQGADPAPVAARFPQLHVLAAADSPSRLRRCRELAAAGHGLCERYGDVNQLPMALTALLAG